MAKNSINKEVITSNDEALNDKPLVGEVVRPKTKIEIIKAKLASQPKVRIIIPKEGKEIDGAFETVQVNGYTYQIKKGVYVEVPQQIAEIIMDSRQQTDEALEKAKAIMSNDERPEFDNSK